MYVGELFDEKNQRSKISCQAPFKIKKPAYRLKLLNMYIRQKETKVNPEPQNMSCIGTMSRDFSPRSFIKRAILNILYG
jgi:hypothetical protein